MPQLLAQFEDVLNISKFLHPGAKGVFILDWSSVYEAFAGNVLNVNNMKISLGGWCQRNLRDTVIPHNNPSPQHDSINDIQGHTRTMVYPAYYPDPKLAGKPKSMLQVLCERE